MGRSTAPNRRFKHKVYSEMGRSINIILHRPDENRARESTESRLIHTLLKSEVSTLKTFLIGFIPHKRHSASKRFTKKNETNSNR